MSQHMATTSEDERCIKAPAREGSSVGDELRASGGLTRPERDAAIKPATPRMPRGAPPARCGTFFLAAGTWVRWHKKKLSRRSNSGKWVFLRSTSLCSAHLPVDAADQFPMIGSDGAYRRHHGPPLPRHLRREGADLYLLNSDMYLRVAKG